MHSTDDLGDCYLGSGTRLRLAIKKYGVDAFETTILEAQSNRKALEKAEARIVTQVVVDDSMSYNLRVGGVGGKAKGVGKGVRLSDAIRKRMSEARSGKPSPMAGKRHSESSKQLMSAVRKGTMCGAANHRFGTHPSEESLKRMSIAQAGGNNPNARAIVLTHPDGTEEAFDCINAAAHKHGLSQGNLSWVLSGKFKHTKQFRAKFQDANTGNN